MRKNLAFSCIIAASLTLSSCGQTNKVSEGKGVSNSEIAVKETGVKNAISEERIAESLKFLSSDELEGRKTGTPGIETAAKSIENKFKTAGIKPFFETYRDSFEIEGVTGYNIVGFKEGTDPALKDEVIIIGAHYDHVGAAKPVGLDSLANGANDNASGTVSVLEVADFLADKDTKRSILFALFSAEEMGLVGSKKLAKKLKEQGLDPYLMFNIEMVGVPMTDKDYLGYLTGYNRSNLPEVFNEYAGEKVLGFLPQAEKFNLFKRSDNYAFFEEFGIPAHTLSTFDFTNYDYYHHVDDEFSEMNTAHMEKVIEAIIPPLYKIANAEESEIKMKE